MRPWRHTSPELLQAVSPSCVSCGESKGRCLVMLLCCSSPVLCWRSLITATRCWLSFPQSSWTPGRYQHSSSFGPSCYEGRSHYTWVETFERPIHWLRIQERIQYKLCVNIIWHHPTCPTNFNKSLEWSPYSVWDHRVRQRSSYQLLEGRRSSLGDRAFLVAAARAWNSVPSTVTAASTLHSFRRALKTHLFTASFPPVTISVTLSAFWANVTCYYRLVCYYTVLFIRWPCGLLTLRHHNLFFFTLHYITLHRVVARYLNAEFIN